MELELLLANELKMLNNALDCYIESLITKQAPMHYRIKELKAKLNNRRIVLLDPVELQDKIRNE
jgi:hypothetical protein